MSGEAWCLSRVHILMEYPPVHNAILTHVAPSSLVIVQCRIDGSWVEYVGTPETIETAKKEGIVIKCDNDALLGCGVYLLVSPGNKARDVAYNLVRKGGAYNAAIRNPRVWSGGVWRPVPLGFWQGR